MRGVEEGVEVPTTYVVYLSRIHKSMRRPVLGCPAVAHSAGRLREYFTFQHFRSQIVVVQEGKEPLPRCNLFRMHMPAVRLIKH